ncbi:MAG: hypothetical protein J6W23_11030 [Victivallales bacterium]|nr:hypothetical protein [Victivallales bacterium]
MNMTQLTPIAILLFCLIAIYLQRKKDNFISNNIEKLSVFQLVLITIIGIPLVLLSINWLYQTIMQYLWN